MTLENKELFSDETPQSQALRAFPREDGIFPGKLAQQSSATALPNLTPLWIDNATKTWKVWAGETNEVNTITSNATPATAGTFTLTINGEVSDPIDFDATAAEVQAAIEAMDLFAPGDVVAVGSGGGTDLGDASHVVTLTWGGDFAGEDMTISIQTGGLTGNAHALATTQAGGATQSGDVINGFLWAPDEAFVPSTTGEVLIQVFRRGIIHRDDIPVPTGESQVDLDEALLASSLREQGIDIQGLVGIG